MSGDPDQGAQARELLATLPELRAPTEATVVACVDSLGALVTMARTKERRDALQARFTLLAAARAAARLPYEARLRVQNLLTAAELFLDGTLTRQAFYQQFPPHRSLPPTPQLQELWDATLSGIGASWRTIGPDGVAPRYLDIAVQMAREHAAAVAAFDDTLLRGRRNRRARAEQLALAAGELAHAEEAASQRADLERLTAGLIASVLSA